MKIRKHFRTNPATIDLLIVDFGMNKISNKDKYLRECIENRIEMLNKRYDRKIDKIITFIIKYFNPEDLPLETISRLIYSISKVVNSLTKGISYLI